MYSLRLLELVHMHARVGPHACSLCMLELVHMHALYTCSSWSICRAGANTSGRLLTCVLACFPHCSCVTNFASFSCIHHTWVYMNRYRFEYHTKIRRAERRGSRYDEHASSVSGGAPCAASPATLFSRSVESGLYDQAIEARTVRAKWLQAQTSPQLQAWPPQGSVVEAASGYPSGPPQQPQQRHDLASCEYRHLSGASARVVLVKVGSLLARKQAWAPGEDYSLRHSDDQTQHLSPSHRYSLDSAPKAMTSVEMPVGRSR